MKTPFDYTLGVVVGKYSPLTQGHINLINEAAAACKHTLVVMSYDDKFLKKQSPRDQKRLTKLNRLRWLEQTFKDTPHVSVVCLDESNLPAYPNGWEPWTKLLESIMENFCKEKGISPTNKDICLFSSETDYDENYKKYFPYIEHEVVDNSRTQVPVSATKIRNEIYKYWEFIPSIVRVDYAIKVLVTGVESVGKTSLTKALAKLFNTSWSAEEGRIYCESVLGSELTLRASDYPVIAYQHKVNQLQDLSRANKVCFFDTGVFSTLFFHQLYATESSKENDLVSDILSCMVENEEWDLVLELSDGVPWVADGMRQTSNRSKSADLWGGMKILYPNQFPEGRTVQITSESYRGRLHEAKDAVFSYMNEFEKGMVNE